MAYRLKRKEPLLEGICRIAREQIGVMVGELVETPDIHEAVHLFRKHCKRMRALLRLVRPLLGETFAFENAWYRDAARGFAACRDAEALLETLKKFEAREAGLATNSEFQRIRHILEGQRDQALRQEDVDLSARLAKQVEDLKHAQARIVDWRLTSSREADLRAGFVGSYRRGKAAFRAAKRERSNEAYHEWRKRVKDLGHQLHLLEGLWKPVIHVYRLEAEVLGELLGDDHDLAVLELLLETWKRESRVEIRFSDWQGRCADRRRELQHLAERQGQRLFSEKPGALKQRLAVCWKCWRG